MAIVRYTPEEMETAKEKKSEYEPLPKGIYFAFIESVEDRISKSGTSYVNVTLSLDTPNGSRRVYDIWSFNSEKGRALALARTGELMRILGLPDNSGQVDTDRFVGMDVRVSIGISENKETGRKKNVVYEYLPKNDTVSEEDDSEYFPEGEDIF